MLLTERISNEKWLKTADNAIDKLFHFLERFKNRLTFDNLRLSERYIKSELKILVGLLVVGRCGDSHNFIAAYPEVSAFQGTILCD